MCHENGSRITVNEVTNFFAGRLYLWIRLEKPTAYPGVPPPNDLLLSSIRLIIQVFRARAPNPKQIRPSRPAARRLLTPPVISDVRMLLDAVLQFHDRDT